MIFRLIRNSRTKVCHKQLTHPERPNPLSSDIELTLFSSLKQTTLFDPLKGHIYIYMCVCVCVCLCMCVYAWNFSKRKVRNLSPWLRVHKPHVYFLWHTHYLPATRKHAFKILCKLWSAHNCYFRTSCIVFSVFKYWITQWCAIRPSGV